MPSARRARKARLLRSPRPRARAARCALRAGTRSAFVWAWNIEQALEKKKSNVGEPEKLTPVCPGVVENVFDFMTCILGVRMLKFSSGRRGEGRWRCQAGVAL